jgi:hypothetical protein
MPMRGRAPSVDRERKSTYLGAEEALIEKLRPVFEKSEGIR